MNIWGKVFVWLVVPAALAAMVLTTQMLGVRNSWWKQVLAQEERIKQNEELLKQKRMELAAARAAYDRTMLGWDRYWTDVNAQPAGDGQGGLVLSLGAADLVTRDADGNEAVPLVYAFQPTAEGGYKYVGEFKAAQLDRGQFLPNWRFRPGDDADWRAGANWRVRTMIPAAERTRFSDLEVRFAIADEALSARQADVQRQEGLARLAAEHLALRVGEIEGFEELQGKEAELPLEVIQGTLATLLAEEEIRNQLLAEVDRLRHELHETTKKFSDITRQNEQLAQSLPAASESTTATARLSAR